MNADEAWLLRELPFPEHASLLILARAFGVRTRWPRRQRRWRGRMFRYLLRGADVPIHGWVVHELHLSGALDPEAALQRWMRGRVLPGANGDFNACTVSVQRPRRHLVVIVIMARTGQGPVR